MTYFFRPVFELVARKSLRRTVQMVITPEEFRFRTWRGWRAFDRALDHRFTLVLHDRAGRERDRNELEERKAQQNRRVIQKRRYFQESWHLSFNYVKQRNDIVSIYGAPGCARRAGTPDGPRRGHQRPRQAGRRYRHEAGRPVGRATRRHP